ncbi:transcriptional regulator SlyA [compost metagenome]
MIRGLEDEGLVERTMDPEDRRAVRITITDAGRAIIRAAHEERMSTFNRLVEHLGEEDSLQLAELLSKVYTFFDAQVPEQHEGHDNASKAPDTETPEQGDDTP